MVLIYVRFQKSSIWLRSSVGDKVGEKKINKREISYVIMKYKTLDSYNIIVRTAKMHSFNFDLRCPHTSHLLHMSKINEHLDTSK